MKVKQGCKEFSTERKLSGFLVEDVKDVINVAEIRDKLVVLQKKFLLVVSNEYIGKCLVEWRAHCNTMSLLVHSFVETKIN